MGGAKKAGTPQDAYALFKYGMPIYGLAWPEGDVFYMCGGGGAVKSGIKNRLVCAKRLHGMLTDQLAEHNFGLNCPMRLAISPNGKTVALAMAQGGIQRLNITLQGDTPKLTPATGELAEKLAADKTVYKPLAFSARGDYLVMGGGDDGSLRVVRWPTLEVKMCLKGDKKLVDSIRDISCAPGPRASRCALVLDNKTAEVWDWDTHTCVCKAGVATRGELRTDTVIAMSGPETSAIQALPPAMSGAGFVCLRYAPHPPTPGSGPTPGSSSSTPSSSSSTGAGPSGDQMYALMNNRNGAWLVCWEQSSATGMLHILRYKHLSPEPASCFDVSRCGRLLAVGTSQSTILVVDAATFTTLRTRPKAHTVFCTGVIFSADGQHVLSVSADASATLTPTAPQPGSKVTLQKVLIMLILLFCMVMTTFLQVVRTLRAQGKVESVERIHEHMRAVSRALHIPQIPASWKQA